MACPSPALVAANACTFTAQTFLRQSQRIWSQKTGDSSFMVRASLDDSDCNADECAPDKEVGKISVEWLAGEKTRVIGTYPPKKRGWTGYVEKDTAGQTNIYSVEPAVYVAESGISSGSAGTSADGTEQTATRAAGIAFIAIAAASLILLQVGKTPSQPQTLQYSGPTLTYYINKFTPQEIIQPSVPTTPPEAASPVLTDPPEVTETAAELEVSPSY